MKTSRCYIALLVCAIWLAPAGWAFGQRKPDPPAWPPKEGPRESEVSDEFLAAYKRAGSPRLLVFSYLLTVDAAEEERRNEVGVVHMFNARLQNQFSHPEVTLKHVQTMALRGKEGFVLLARNRFEPRLEAARLLGREADADVVIFVLLTDQSWRNDDVRYAASYVILDVNRNDSIGQWSWEMTPDEENGNFTARRLGQYCKALAKRISRDFALYNPRQGGGAARRYTLNIFGVPEENIKLFRDELRNVSGVKDVLRPQLTTQAGLTLVAMDIRYAGDPFDLSIGLRSAARSVLDMDVAVRTAREGVIELVAQRRPATTVESLLNGDEPPPGRETQARQLKERFANAYKSNGTPSIAVVINMVATQTPEEQNKPGDVRITISPRIIIHSSVDDSGRGDLAPTEHSGSGDPHHEPPATPGKHSTVSEEQVLNTSVMEDLIRGRLLKLPVRVKDLEQAWRILAQERALERRVFGEEQLALLLGRKSGANIVISGVGRVVPQHGSAASREVQYTFKAISTISSDVLGTCHVYRELAPGSGDIHILSDSLAAEAVGRLTYQMLLFWERSG